MFLKRILQIVCLVCFSTNLSAQTITPKAPLILNLDYSRFHYDNQNCYLEVYYGFHPKHLTYDHSSGKFEAGVKLSTKIRERDSGNYLVDQHALLAISENDTNAVWYNFPFTTQNGYAVPKGEYVLEVIATDSLDNARSDSLNLDITFEPFTTTSISDLELCKNIKPSQDKDLLFYKNSLEVLPFPSLIFGATTAPVVFYYIELYNVDPNRKYNLKTEIMDASENVIRKTSKERQFRSTSSLEVGTTPVSTFESGKYSIRFSLLDESQNQIASTEKTFFAFNPHLQPKIEGPGKNIFISMTEKELDNEYTWSKYLATDNEKELYPQLEGLEAKSNFLLKLWSEVSKGRGDMPPISRGHYLRRKQIADNKFKRFGKEGWESDQGRVYMIYADPDEIERAPQESSENRHEVWRYFNIEKGVIFVFVDRYGFGNLELVHSTKRGEFQDESWERYLRNN